MHGGLLTSTLLLGVAMAMRSTTAVLRVLCTRAMGATGTLFIDVMLCTAASWRVGMVAAMVSAELCRRERLGRVRHE
jgi:hypothetical protein